MVDHTKPSQSLFGSDRLPRLGSHVASYEVGERLGTGAVGVIHKAMDTETNVPVAIKFLRPQWAIHKELFDGFLRRADELRRVEHLNVAEVAATGIYNDELPYMVMEFVAAGDLGSQLAARSSAMSSDEALLMADQICGGLGAMHAASIVHGDLKPSDILLARGHRVVVHDFSLLAESLEAGVGMSLCRDLTYMAPEVRATAKTTTRSDVYSAARVISHLLLGELPEQVQPDQLLGVPDLPDFVVEALIAAMDLEPGRRPASAPLLRHALKRGSIRPSAPRQTAILLVDDDPEFLAWAAATLRGSLDGVEVESHTNVDDALLAFETGLYAMVITDLNMPVRDGAFLTRAVRDVPSEVPVIVVTGVGSAAHWRKLKADGATTCVLKPVDRATFVAVVTAHLSL